MKPRNKTEREAVEISNSIPRKDNYYVRLSYEQLFKHYYSYRKKDKTCFCFECGHRWKEDNIKEYLRCPNCGKKVIFTKMHGGKKVETSSVSIHDFKGDWQILRTFLVKKMFGKGNPVYRNIEFERYLFNIKTHEHVLIAAPLFMGRINYYDEMSIKRDYIHDGRRCIWGNITYYNKIHPVLRKMGYKKNMDIFEPHFVLENIFLQPHLETILKLKDGACKRFLSFLKIDFINKNWSIIKQVMKNNYYVKDELIPEWKDSIEMAHEMNINITPKIFLTDNVKKTHDKLLEKRRKIHTEKEKEQYKRDLKNALEIKPDELHKKFIGFHYDIPKTEMKIVALAEPFEYVKEGYIMHHCLGTYIHTDNTSLMFSVIEKNNHVATIEYDTEEDKIVQCRGKYNCIPKEQEHILNAFPFKKVKRIITND